MTLTSATANKEYDGNALTDDTVTVSGDGFADGEGASYNVTGSQRAVGNSENTFTYTLNEGTNKDNYNITQTLGTLTVTSSNASYEITVEANSDTVLYDGQSHSVGGFKTLEFTVGSNKYTVSGLSAGATGTDAGEYAANITGTAVVTDAYGNDVTSEFTVKTVNGKLTVSKRNVTLTSATDSKQYDGTPLTSKVVTPGGEGWANGEGATYNVTGSRTLVGSSANTFKYTLNANTDENNYTITKSEGTLTILNREAKYQITVEANSATDTYDGIEKSASGFKTLTFTENGQTYTVSGLTAEAAATDAGNYPVNVLGIPMVKDADGNDVTPQFSVDTRNGTLTIEKRKVTLLSASFTKPYDGKALTNNNAPLVTEEGWADGEGATYTFTGTQTLAGDSANAFTYKLNSNTKDSNYNIDKQEGRLIVRDRDQKYAIVVEANSDTVTYNGKEQAVSGLVATTFVTEDGNTYTVEGLKAEAKATDAGTYTAAITGETIVRDSAGNDVTRQFAVVKENGTLTIRKAPLTLTAASASKPYDGTELTAHNTASITGAVEGEQVDTAELRYEGSQTEIGSSLNRIMQDSVRVVNPGFLGIRALGGKDTTANYEIRLVDGTLTVNQRNDLEYTINRIFLDRSGNEADRDVTRSQQAYYGEKILKTAPEIETTWKDSHYMLLPAWGDYQETKDKTVTLKAEDNIVNIYYALDDAATGSPEENKGDRIPDMYQIVFTYTAKENGTVSGVTTEAVTVQELVKDQNGLVIETGGRKPASPTQPSTVKANDGYYFHHWNNGSVELKDDAAVKAGSYETDTTFTAFFKENPDNAWTAEKRVTNIPSRGYFRVGEDAHFSIRVTNTGNRPLKDVKIHETLKGAVISASANGQYTLVNGDAVIAELAVGQSVTVEATYKVTREDLFAREFRNIVVTSATIDSEEPGAKPVGDVTADTGRIPAGAQGSGGSSGGGGGGGSSSGTRSPGTGGGPAGPGVPTVTIDPEAVPLANLPEMGNDDILALIDDEEVPLAALPKTGQAGSAALMLMISSMMLAAFAVVTRKKEEEQ